MRKIKIKICNFDKNDKSAYGYFFINIFKKFYEVELSEEPEYLFFNESSLDYLKYDCIKIFYTAENVHPNFNFCDYAIGYDYLSFGDRYYRLPIYQVATFFREKELSQVRSFDFTEQKIFTPQDLKKKTEFCSFVYSNYLAAGARRDFFDRLNLYKKVNAGGSYLNNIGKKVDNKLEFESKHKFSIAFENSSNLGYTTEKIVTSLLARTIPIYWGNPGIEKEFNPDRFINCHQYDNFDQVIEKVKEIDLNENLYLDMINQPMTAKDYDFQEVKDNFVIFLKNIIDQPPNLAKRIKINPARNIELKKKEGVALRYLATKSKIKSILSRLYQPFKNIKLLEKTKQTYFINKNKQ